MRKILKKISASLMLILMIFSVAYNVLDYGYKTYAVEVDDIVWYPVLSQQLPGTPKLAIMILGEGYSSQPNTHFNIETADNTGYMGAIFINQDYDNYYYNITTDSNLVTIEKDPLYNQHIYKFNVKLKNGYIYRQGDSFNYTITESNTYGETGSVTYKASLVNNFNSNYMHVSLIEHFQNDDDNNVTQTSNFRFREDGYGLLNVYNDNSNVYNLRFNVTSNNTNIFTVTSQSLNIFRINPTNFRNNGSEATITVTATNPFGVEVFSRAYIINIYAEEKTTITPSWIVGNDKLKYDKDDKITLQVLINKFKENTELEAKFSSETVYEKFNLSEPIKTASGYNIQVSYADINKVKNGETYTIFLKYGDIEKSINFSIADEEKISIRPSWIGSGGKLKYDKDTKITLQVLIDKFKENTELEAKFSSETVYEKFNLSEPIKTASGYNIQVSYTDINKVKKGETYTIFLKYGDIEKSIDFSIEGENDENENKELETSNFILKLPTEIYNKYIDTEWKSWMNRWETYYNRLSELIQYTPGKITVDCTQRSLTLPGYSVVYGIREGNTIKLDLDELEKCFDKILKQNYEYATLIHEVSHTFENNQDWLFGEEICVIINATIASRNNTPICDYRNQPHTNYLEYTRFRSQSDKGSYKLYNEIALKIIEEVGIDAIGGIIVENRGNTLKTDLDRFEKFAESINKLQGKDIGAIELSNGQTIREYMGGSNPTGFYYKIGVEDAQKIPDDKQITVRVNDAIIITVEGQDTSNTPLTVSGKDFPGTYNKEKGRTEYTGFKFIETGKSTAKFGQTTIAEFTIEEREEKEILYVFNKDGIGENQVEENKEYITVKTDRSYVTDYKTGDISGATNNWLINGNNEKNYYCFSHGKTLKFDGGTYYYRYEQYKQEDIKKEDQLILAFISNVSTEEASKIGEITLTGEDWRQHAIQYYIWENIQKPNAGNVSYGILSTFMGKIKPNANEKNEYIDFKNETITLDGVKYKIKDGSFKAYSYKVNAKYYSSTGQPKWANTTDDDIQPLFTFEVEIEEGGIPTIYLLKIDGETSKLLKNAKFKAFKYDEEAYQLTPIGDELVTNENDKIAIKGISLEEKGKYLLKEIKAPETYSMTTEYILIEVDPNAEETVKITTYKANQTEDTGTGEAKLNPRYDATVENSEIWELEADEIDGENIIYTIKVKNYTTTVKLKKVDETTNQGLAGAIFTAYEEGDNKTLVEKVKTNPTDENGYTNLDEIFAKHYVEENGVKQIIIKETTAPEGYATTETIYVIEYNTTDGKLSGKYYETEDDWKRNRNEKELTIEDNTISIIIPNKIGTPTLELEKIDPEGKAIIGKGGKFEVTIRANNEEVSKQTYELNENGKIKLEINGGMEKLISTNENRIPIEITIKETDAPEGYTVGEHDTFTFTTYYYEKTGWEAPRNVQGYGVFTVNKNGAKISMTLINEKDVPRIKINKTGENGNSIEGTIEFTVYTDVQCTNSIGTITIINGVTTTLEIPNPRQGANTYYLKETTTPLGYKELPYTIELTVNIDNSGNIVNSSISRLLVQSGQEQTTYPQPSLIRNNKNPNLITFNIVNEIDDEKAKEVALKIKKIDGNTSTPLSGVTFDIQGDVQNSGAQSTDSNGEINIGKIQVDQNKTYTITITETSPIPGYQENSEPMTIEFTKNSDGSISDIKLKTLNFDSNIAYTITNGVLDMTLNVKNYIELPNFTEQAPLLMYIEGQVWLDGVSGKESESNSLLGDDVDKNLEGILVELYEENGSKLADVAKAEDVQQALDDINEIQGTNSSNANSLSTISNQIRTKYQEAKNKLESDQQENIPIGESSSITVYDKNVMDAKEALNKVIEQEKYYDSYVYGTYTDKDGQEQKKSISGFKEMYANFTSSSSPERYVEAWKEKELTDIKRTTGENSDAYKACVKKWEYFKTSDLPMPSKEMKRKAQFYGLHLKCEIAQKQLDLMKTQNPVAFAVYDFAKNNNINLENIPIFMEEVVNSNTKSMIQNHLKELQTLQQQGIYNTTVTDENGKFKFYGLNPDKKYVVKYTYNGMRYEDVDVLYKIGSTVSQDVLEKSSKAVENEAERTELTNRFREIGTYPYNYTTKIYTLNTVFSQEQVNDAIEEGQGRAGSIQKLYLGEGNNQEIYSNLNEYITDSNYSTRGSIVQFIKDTVVSAKSEPIGGILEKAENDVKAKNGQIDEKTKDMVYPVVNKIGKGSYNTYTEALEEYNRLKQEDNTIVGYVINENSKYFWHTITVSGHEHTTSEITGQGELIKSKKVYYKEKYIEIQYSLFPNGSVSTCDWKDPDANPPPGETVDSCGATYGFHTSRGWTEVTGYSLEVFKIEDAYSNKIDNNIIFGVFEGGEAYFTENSEYPGTYDYSITYAGTSDVYMTYDSLNTNYGWGKNPSRTAAIICEELVTNIETQNKTTEPAFANFGVKYRPTMDLGLYNDVQEAYLVTGSTQQEITYHYDKRASNGGAFKFGVNYYDLGSPKNVEEAYASYYQNLSNGRNRIR